MAGAAGDDQHVRGAHEGAETRGRGEGQVVQRCAGDERRPHRLTQRGAERGRQEEGGGGHRWSVILREFILQSESALESAEGGREAGWEGWLRSAAGEEIYEYRYWARKEEL